MGDACSQRAFASFWEVLGVGTVERSEFKALMVRNAPRTIDPPSPSLLFSQDEANFLYEWQEGTGLSLLCARVKRR